MNYNIILLNSGHKKDNFECGKASLDDYIKKQAKQDTKRFLSACYVLENDENEVKGYFTLSSTSIPRDDMPNEMLAKLPKGYHDFPANFLADWR